MQTLHLFPTIDHLLIDLLSTLKDSDWNKSTVAKKWTVKDVAAHLLDVTMRDVSIYRDEFSGNKPANLHSYQDLVAYLNELNAIWVNAFKRVSPAQIIEMLDKANNAQYTELCKLDPQKPAIYSVAWAGEITSTNEFHIAREYTEKYHHQLQIRDAVGKCKDLMTVELFTPFIHTLLRGLPHTYREINSSEGTCINIGISPYGNWQLIKEVKGWRLEVGGSVANSTTSIHFDPETAWKLFTKAITKEEALKKVSIEGNKELGEIALSMISVMA